MRVWPVTRQMVPNIDGTEGNKIKTRSHSMTLDTVLRSTQQSKTQLENAITVFGPRLYNSLPKYRSDIRSVKSAKFKLVLDKFLERIPVHAKMSNYVLPASSNCILDQPSHSRGQGIYN